MGEFFLGWVSGVVAIIIASGWWLESTSNKCAEKHNVHSCEMIYVPNTAVELIEKYKGKDDE